jgi:hypothetical protein
MAKTTPFNFRIPLVDKDGRLTREWQERFRELYDKTAESLTLLGKLADADHIAADGATYARVNVGALTSGNVDLAKSGVTNKTASNIEESSERKWRTPAHSTYRFVGGTTITATQVGASATATIPAETMRVPGLDDFAVDAGNVSGLAFVTKYYIYYDDPAFVGGAVTYYATTNADVAYSGVGRFCRGSVTTPADGGEKTEGRRGGGGGGGDLIPL